MPPPASSSEASPTAPGQAPVAPVSVEAVADGLRSVGYLPGESTALVSYLAT